MKSQLANSLRAVYHGCRMTNCDVINIKEYYYQRRYDTGYGKLSGRLTQ